MTIVLKKPVIALLMPLAIHPEIPPPPPVSGTAAGGIALVVGTGEGDVLGCGMQSAAGHDEAVPDGVGIGLGVAEVVGSGAGAGLGLGSATAVNTEAHTARTTNPRTRARRRRRRPRRLGEAAGGWSPSADVGRGGWADGVSIRRPRSL
ncbi:hypothetical protein [Streptomyces acidiscabies]|uniref:Uncharacterized protein n=1 Tax=Streptomyces acidiscabies TaxID=42234 RepID=A0AAP6BM83_9ACTN|nr:hypothetical protein [Streptomyces acidiscabies]MBZ3913704.1 hypothetical protein [Streptomyces acidiscabies]MDX2967195.1 hypothetical protein [Streptomyces acidiscabies]MDX3025909.1 hypothetical protein [Streptomyces acidiscabies]MDX3796833.1 hypothetical protein [Streptomyces acidiscabies]